MELTGWKTPWGWVLLICIAAWYILLKGKPELCVAEGEDVTVPVGEREKTGRRFPKRKREL